MLEWDDVTRHWWRYDQKRVAMIHRASCEAIVYCGVLPENGWHRFDYEHDGETYPLAVQMKTVEYRNPDPDRYVGHPWRGNRIPVLKPWIWRIDHIRSEQLWRELGNHDAAPPYWLWRRVDIAMSDAALLWPRHLDALKPAEEVLINGGWANGEWSPEYYRQLRWYEKLEEEFIPSARRKPDRGLALPLKEHRLFPRGECAPRWTCGMQLAIDRHGQRLDAQTSMMVNGSEGSLLAKTPDDLRSSMDNKTGAVIYLREGFHCALPFYSTDSVDIMPVGRMRNPTGTAPTWSVSISAPASIGMTDSTCLTQPDFLDRPVRAADALITGQPRWKYDPDIIDRVNSSYVLSQVLADTLMQALPFSPGFDANSCHSPERQGDIGRVQLRTCFCGGILGIETNVRLHRRLRADQDGTDWDRFF